MAAATPGLSLQLGTTRDCEDLPPPPLVSLCPNTRFRFPRPPAGQVRTYSPCAKCGAAAQGEQLDRPIGTRRHDAFFPRRRPPRSAGRCRRRPGRARPESEAATTNASTVRRLSFSGARSSITSHQCRQTRRNHRIDLVGDIVVISLQVMKFGLAPSLKKKYFELTGIGPFYNPGRWIFDSSEKLKWETRRWTPMTESLRRRRQTGETAVVPVQDACNGALDTCLSCISQHTDQLHQCQRKPFLQLTLEPKAAQQFAEASLRPRLTAPRGPAAPTRLRTATGAGEDRTEATEVWAPPLVRHRLRVLLKPPKEPR
jgi:hypothetical protein